jgi:hypothetical protein
VCTCVQIHVLAVMLKWKTAEHKEMFKKVWGGLAQIVYKTVVNCTFDPTALRRTSTSKLHAVFMVLMQCGRMHGIARTHLHSSSSV